MSTLVQQLREAANELARLTAENARLLTALMLIAVSDDTENALDPERNKRVARVALAQGGE